MTAIFSERIVTRDQGLAGEWSQDTPFLLALVAFAVVWKHHPLARVSIRGVRGLIDAAVTGLRRARSYGVDRAPARPVVDSRTRFPEAV